MTKWEPRDGIASLPPLTRTVHSIVMQKVSESNEQALQLLSVTTAYAPEGECIEIAFTFECPGGLRVEIEYTEAFDIRMLYDSEVTDVDWAEDLIDKSIRYLRNTNLKDIEDKVHEDRMKIRQTLEEWRRRHGICAYLLDSAIRFTDSSFSALCHHSLTLSMANEPIQSVSSALDVKLFDQIKKRDLAQLLSDLRRRFSALSALGARGADGKIDLLALRALEVLGPAESALRRRACLTTSPPYSSRFKSIDRHVYLDEIALPSPTISFQRSSIVIYDSTLPDTVLAYCTGMQITKIVEHPYLCDSMIVKGATLFDEPDSNCIIFEIDQPVYYFCSLSGRYWAEASAR